MPAFKVDFDSLGTSAIRKIKILDEWAYMWTKLTVVVTPPAGDVMTRAGHSLAILRRENGRWVLARDTNMLARVAGG